MRPLLVLSLSCILLSPACRKTVTTPTGAEVLHWDKSMSDRPSVLGARELGARAIREVKVVAHPDSNGPVTLNLHFETALLEFVETGKTFRHTAPVAVRATVEENEDWDISGRCLGGPYYQIGPVGEEGVMTSPEAMTLTCDVSMHYKSVDDVTMIGVTMLGDGRVKTNMSFGTATLEEPPRAAASARPGTSKNLVDGRPASTSLPRP